MNTRIGLLAGIVCVQLLIVGYLLFGQGSGAEQRLQLIDQDLSEVQQLEIADADNAVMLESQDGQWRVAGYPADGAKIQSLLTKLASLQATWPVASTASAAERFETNDSGFQRRLRLRDAAGDTLAELFTGTSPGYQRVHARMAGSSEIYSVELSNYELGVKVDDWLDKAVYALDDAPKSVTVTFASGEPAQTLQETADGWMINGAPAAADPSSTYANRFTTLQVLGLASDEDVVSAAVVAELALAANGEQATLVISRLPDEGEYLLHGDRVEGHYRVATYIAEQLLMSDVEFAATASSGDQVAGEDAEGGTEDTDAVTDKIANGPAEQDTGDN